MSTMKFRARRLATIITVAVLGLLAVPPVAASAANPTGYVLAAADGGVFAFGTIRFHGSMAGVHLNSPIVGIALTRDADGYWLVAADGGVFAFGSARFFGSMGATPLNQPIVGMAAAPDGLGYWLVAADGGVFAFGSAKFHGSLSGAHILAPVVGIAPTAVGDGYFLLTASGELFGEGAVLARGAPPAFDLPARAAPYVGLTAVPGENDTVEAVTAQGDTALHGPVGGCAHTLPFSPLAPVVGIGGAGSVCETTTGWLAASDGGVFTLDRTYLGSMGDTALVAPIVGIAGV
jgi:hypothetical protein